MPKKAAKAKKPTPSKKEKIHPIVQWIQKNSISVGHPITWKELLNR